MDILFTCQPGLGHFHPLTPLAGALREAGHRCLFAGRPLFAPFVSRAGFEILPAGMDWLESEVTAAFPELMADPADLAGFRKIWPHVFSRTGKALLDDLIPAVRETKPALVISESMEMAGPLAAECAGVPHVVYGIGPFFKLPFLQPLYARPWNSARAELSLRADPNLDLFAPYLYLDAYPASLHGFPPAAHLRVAHSIRPVAELTSNGWAEGRSGLPTIVVTLGTVYNRIQRVWSSISAALAGQPARVVIAVSGDPPPDLDPKFQIVSNQSYSEIFPNADLLISHGGYNTLLSALALGVPVLSLPMNTDQTYNSVRAAACGAGLCVNASSAAPETIGDAVHRILTPGSGYRARAQAMAREIADLPPPASFVPLLERLAETRQPVTQPDMNTAHP